MWKLSWLHDTRRVMSGRNEDKVLCGTEKAWVPQGGKARRGTHHGSHRREGMQTEMMMMMLEIGLKSEG